MLQQVDHLQEYNEALNPADETNWAGQTAFLDSMACSPTPVSYFLKHTLAESETYRTLLLKQVETGEGSLRSLGHIRS